MVSEIFVQIRSNYGSRAVYPLCSTGQRLAALAGTKTLTPEAISLIKGLGYSVYVKPEEVTL